MAEISNLLLHEGQDVFYFFLMCCANSFSFVFNKDFHVVNTTSCYVTKFVICCINLYFINEICTWGKKLQLVQMSSSIHFFFCHLLLQQWFTSGPNVLSDVLFYHQHMVARMPNVFCRMLYVVQFCTESTMWKKAVRGEDFLPFTEKVVLSSGPQASSLPELCSGYSFSWSYTLWTWNLTLELDFLAYLEPALLLWICLI